MRETDLQQSYGQNESHRTFALDCSFESSGVWAGFGKFIEDLWPRLLAVDPESIVSHHNALRHIVPWLLPAEPEALTLTDRANDAERVRSYAIDRALRIPYSLADFLIEANGRIEPGCGWVLECYGWNSVSETGKLLVEALGLSSQNKGALQVRTFAHALPEQRRSDAEQRCTVTQVLENEANVPRALHQVLATEENPITRVRLNLRAVAYYCAHGFYKDAARYADGLLEQARVHCPADSALLWNVAFKSLNACLGAGQIERAKELAEIACPELVHGSSKRESDLLYIRAMICARFTTPRDYTLGEKLLSDAIDVLDEGELGSSQFHFSRVFLANGLAMIRMFQGRLEEALDITSRGIAELDEHLEAQEQQLHRSVLVYNLSQLNARMKRYPEALGAINEAIAADPNYSEYYNERGSIQFALGNPSEALDDYHTALQLSAPYSEVLVNMAQCMRSLGDYEHALANYERALEFDPTGVLALSGAASCCHAMEAFDAAVAYYDRAISHDGKAWELLANRAAAHYALDRYEEALTDIDAAILLRPTDDDLKQNRAFIAEAAATAT